jgi:hypothetical protein
VRYTPEIYSQIKGGFRWPEYNANAQPTGGTIPRPYYVNNSGLGAGAASTNSTYFDDDQLYDMTTDPDEDTNLHGKDPETAYRLKKRLAEYIGGIAGRPFRQTGDSSTEFSPAPASAPAAPASLRMQFLGINSVKLDWSDVASSELGYVVRKAIRGGDPQIIAELPPGTTTVTAALEPGIEDIVLQVASYNARGDSAVSEDLLAPESWRYRTFGSIDPALSLPISRWNNDADGDGVSTLWEYACGTDPRVSTSVARPEVRIGSGAGGPFLEYMLPRDRRRGLQFVGMVSSDPSSGWRSGPPHCMVVEDGYSHLLFRSATPIGGSVRQFIRAEMVNPPGGPP